jgi:aminoglycoside phosphotransferase (APT) family kinase protein
MRMHGDAQVDSDETLVGRLLLDQFPHWADLPIRRIASDGTDNAMYRLGDDYVARLPLIDWAVAQIDKERLWLPRLAPHLPLAIPEQVAAGRPAHGYPWPWAVYRWIDGANAHPGDLDDAEDAARELAAFVRALRPLDFANVPQSSRGRNLAADDDRIRAAIEAVRDEFDARVLLRIWDAAVAAPPWDGLTVLVHSDLSDGNVLHRDGRLCAVIDFSAFGWGEPANDLDPAWGMFTGPSRAVFRAELDPDDATWARARGWAVSSVYGLVYYRHTNPGIVARCRRRLAAVIEEFETGEP